jgi:glycosyltransferase involved in cell wall biosynthesis
MVVLVVIPTFNERDNLPVLVPGVLAPRLPRPDRRR